MKMKLLSSQALLLASSLFAAATGAASAAQTDLPQSEVALIKRGEYLAHAGDCMACHTAKGGQPFAGGLPLPTPIGTLYSSNITPDKATGIGNYSYEDFDRAVRHGVAKVGYTLYPAMPYPSYAKVTPSDVKALYAYFMHGVPAVNAPRRDNDIPWPFSMRWPLAVWRSEFAPAVALEPSNDTAAGPQAMLARGQYLVEGLGHCGACHTARGTFMQEQALTDGGGLSFLGGGVVENWFAGNLRADKVDGLGQWTQADIVAFLKAGRNAHSAAFGGMRDVVTDSTQYLSDVDLTAMAVYLQSLAPAKPQKTALAYSDTTARGLHAGKVDTPGALLFLNNCAACHRTNGEGYAGVFPRLALSATVNAHDPTSLVNLVLHGASMPSTASAPSSFTMPGFADRLSDQQVADVVNFVRTSWGNQAPTVDARTVQKKRKSTE
jgi:alcohol dehydrogenase (quinone), cytochrome c subunit